MEIKGGKTKKHLKVFKQGFRLHTEQFLISPIISKCNYYTIFRKAIYVYRQPKLRKNKKKDFYKSRRLVIIIQVK